jgi:prepilin-type N-terminal cleavage/methylation domain-containing protein
MKTKGFSLIEIIISLTIIGILTAIVVNSSQISILKKEQEGIIDSIIATLEKAKADAQAGKDGLQHGVKFDLQEYVSFAGSSFSEQNSEFKSIVIHPQFEIIDTISNSDNSIVFSKITGRPNETVIITVSHIDDRIPSKAFQIQASGDISLIE